MSQSIPKYWNCLTHRFLQHPQSRRHLSLPSHSLRVQAWWARPCYIRTSLTVKCVVANLNSHPPSFYTVPPPHFYTGPYEFDHSPYMTPLDSESSHTAHRTPHTVLRVTPVSQ